MNIQFTFSMRAILVIMALMLITSCGGGGSDPDPVIDPPPPSDSTPDSFTFTDQVDIEFDILVQSDSITISGIDIASTISITGGEYSIDGETFVATDGSINNGQSIVVQQTSSSNSKTVTDVVLTIGGVSDTFSVTTILVLNPDFVEKVDAVTIGQINLYEGNVNISNRDIVDLDIDAIKSGDLLTIDIEFEVDTFIDDYAFSIQLVPQSIINQLESGTTLGEMMQDDYIADVGEITINLGGTKVDLGFTGTAHAVLQTKIPAILQDTKYRLLITPDISFLANDKEPQIEEVALVPAFIDGRLLSVSQLEGVILNVIQPPKLLDTNEFTHLEIASNFDENGFSTKPIFQTSVEVDITSFNSSETIELSMSWTTSKGDTFQLGLISSDSLGEPAVSEKASFQVARDGGKSIRVPVVAYVSESAHTAMVAFATDVRDIADRTPESGQFILDIDYVENGGTVDTGVSYEFDLPLVREDLSAQELADEEIINFAVLRAGNTNDGYITIPLSSLDIDTGTLGIDSINSIISEGVAEGATIPDRMYWRYDEVTKQLINKVTDINGENYCMTAYHEELIAPKPIQEKILTHGLVLNEVQLEKCEFAVKEPFEIGPPIEPGTALESQRFELTNDKVKLLHNNYFLTVDKLGFANSDVELIANENIALDIYRNTDGLDLDRNGRVFYVGDYGDYNLGDTDIAGLNLNYGGETFVSYKPVPGIVSRGSADLSLGIFGLNIDIVAANFEYQNHFSKQLTTLSGNLYPVEVGNGSEINFTLLGLPESRGDGITISTITEAYDPFDSMLDYLDSRTNPITIANIDKGTDLFDETLFSQTVLVFGIPLTATGRIGGELSLKGDLTSENFTVNADLASVFKLTATLEASADAGIAEAGIGVTINIIDKKLTFSGAAGFNAVQPPVPLHPEIQYEVTSSLDLKISVLSGEVVVFVEYWQPCACLSLFKKVRKEKTLFQSDGFNEEFDVFSGLSAGGAVTIIEI